MKIKKKIENILDKYDDMWAEDNFVPATLNLVSLFRDEMLEIIGDDERTGKWPLHQSSRAINRNKLRKEMREKLVKTLTNFGVSKKKQRASKDITE